ncbi:MAG: ribonuclease HII [Candidatus Aenigmarchaeota archaeon]|nr:ribonuclease HII [Candidatus Aenigmarchaeota archaeon]
MKVLGIDEAGRGPVLGPMVMCGYLIEEEKLAQLRATGVKDSKVLSAEKRESLVPVLKALCSDYIILKIPCEEIDSCGNLNRLEIDKMRQMIKALKPGKIVVDCPETNTRKFAEKVMGGLLMDAEIICENYADANYAEVSAASVLAKSAREGEIAKLHKEYGYFGTGYTSDERTIAFLKDWLKRNKELPEMARKSWTTSKMLLAESRQAKLW